MPGEGGEAGEPAFTEYGTQTCCWKEGGGRDVGKTRRGGGGARLSAPQAGGKDNAADA